jgi:hypothetical protein
MAKPWSSVVVKPSANLVCSLREIIEPSLYPKKAAGVGLPTPGQNGQYP